jgi:hypothetical protein
MQNIKFGVLEETKTLNDKNTEVIKESGHFKREAEKIHTSKDLIGDKNYRPMSETFDDIIKI